MGRTEEPDFKVGRLRDDDAPARLAEERLRLEREALAVERERLAAARAHMAAEARLSETRHPRLAVVAVALLALSCFAGGLLAGLAVAESRQQSRREGHLARALAQLDALAAETSAPTNAAARPAAHPGVAVPLGAHRNVSVLVIQ